MPESKKSDVDDWVEEERKDPHKLKALENASRRFDDNDSLNVHTLEGLYGQESSFGDQRRSRNTDNAAGDFHIEKRTARELGLTVTSKNDQRFDIDDSSNAAAKYLKRLDRTFSKEAIITAEYKTFPVKNKNERKKFDIAAYNAGAKTIAKAQLATFEAGKDPSQWDIVKEYLVQSGTPEDKAEEIIGHVEKVLQYEKEFKEKSLANKDKKDLEPAELKKQSGDGHWVTIDDHPVFIED